jgi:hypothetical protein
MTVGNSGSETINSLPPKSICKIDRPIDIIDRFYRPFILTYLYYRHKAILSIAKFITEYSIDNIAADYCENNWLIIGWVTKNILLRVPP